MYNSITNFYIMKNIIIITTVCALTLFSCLKPEPFKQPQNLCCEYQENPLGIDDLQPRFSWYVNDTARGAFQTAYHILVSSDPELLDNNIGDIWDTKVVESDQSTHILYQGPPLESRKIYYWKVRTWDQERNPSAWSEPAWWEMALLNKTDWKAKWTGMDMIVEESVLEKYGSWISHPGTNSGKQTLYFRNSFEIPEGKIPRKAFLSVLGKNQGIISVNGKYLREMDYQDDFVINDITKEMISGKNLLAFTVSDKNGSRCELIFNMEIIFSDGSTQWIKSGEQCKVSDIKSTGWDQPDYDDADWQNADIISVLGKDDLEWIKNSGPAPRSTMIRKDFTAPKLIRKARIYVSGLGNYKLFINGNIVGNDQLTPGWTDYRKRIQYQVYDVTDMINKGENAMGMILGNMWWSSGLGWRGGARYSNGPLRGLCQLEIEYIDGSTNIIITDESWRAHLSPIVENTLYHGETYDARLEIEGWAEAGLDDSGWSDATIFTEPDGITLSAQYGPPIQIMQEITPKNINEVSPGIFVFDMGINMVGFARLKVQGESGMQVKLRFAELLHDDGTVAQENLRSAKATDLYILKGTGEEIWHPYFTYHGFRYVQMEGYRGTPTTESLTGLQIYSSAQETGKFECSNSLLNSVWENILNGQKGNMYSVPTDCPQRDERLGWTGDAQMFAPTAMYNMEMARFFTKWTRDMTDSQTEEGWICDVNPAIVVSGPGKPAWGDAITIVPWMVHKFYGDKKILEQSYESMKAWVEYMHRESKDNLYTFDQNGWGGYGDWIAVVESPKPPISAAYYYYSTKILAQAAEILKKSEDATNYSDLSERIAQAFNKKYFDPKTFNYPEATQTANLLPLAFGITPEEYRQQVADNIAQNIITRDEHLSTGFLGTGYILPVLSDYGYHELAYKLAVQTSYPSWGYMVEKGATSMWELWNSDIEPPDEMNSRNHFALGSVGEWYYAYLAGIKPDPDEPGFKHAIIAPKPADELTWAEGIKKTPYGSLRCYWQKDTNGLKIEVTIPTNTSATIKIPVLALESPTIKESGNPIYAAHEPADLPDELKFVETENNTIVFEAGSGRYIFKIE
jgi:alpha-L-rhamnosidase